MRKNHGISFQGSSLHLKYFFEHLPKCLFSKTQKGPVYFLEIKTQEDLRKIEFFKKTHPLSEILVALSPEDLKLKKESLKRGAFYVFQTPLKQNEFQLVLGKIESWWELQSKSCPWIGNSSSSLKVKKQMAYLRDEKGPFLIQGESGTGKEVIATLFVEKQKPKIFVNLASLPSNLFEAQMFGYKKGSFTGAGEDYQGLVKASEGGVLFLDEVEALDLNSQAKLLRFLENQEILALGSYKPQKIETCVVVATNECLEDKVKRKEFRADLLWRLKAKVIVLPPLRQRLDDIEELVNFFISQDPLKRDKKFTPQALLAFKNYHWPGNVRELKQIVCRLISENPSSVIDEDEVLDFLNPDFSIGPTEKISLEKDIQDLSNQSYSNSHKETSFLSHDKNSSFLSENQKNYIASSDLNLSSFKKHKNRSSLSSFFHLDPLLSHSSFRQSRFCSSNSQPSLQSMVKEYEKNLLKVYLDKYKDLSKVQEILRLSRATLYKKIKSYKLY